MFRQISRERIEITRDLAREHSEETSVKGHREHKLTLSADLLRKIVDGRFRADPTWVICFCLEDEKWYSADGRHTSGLFDDETTPITQPEPEGKPFFCNYQRYEADTKSDLVDLYDMFNSRLSGKSKADNNRVRAGLIPELDGVNDRIIGLCVDGLLFADMGISYMYVPIGDRGRRLEGTNDFCAFAVNVLSLGTKAPFMLKEGVVAAMKWSFEDDPEAALEFWLGVRDGSNPNPTSIERKMHDYLIGRMGSNKNAEKTAALKRCHRFWKTWYKARKTGAKFASRAKAQRGNTVGEVMRTAAKRTPK